MIHLADFVDKNFLHKNHEELLLYLIQLYVIQKTVYNKKKLIVHFSPLYGVIEGICFMLIINSAYSLLYNNFLK